MITGRLNRTLLAACGAFALVLAWAPPAPASTVTVTGTNTLRVTETGDQVNRITVGYDTGAGVYTVTDAAANLTASGTCIAADPHRASCPGAGIETISVETGRRGDSIALDPSTIPVSVTERLDGGSGNDTVSGGNGPGSIKGGSGDDVVTGHGSVEGGGGSDVVTGSPGAESIRGGKGSDLIDGGAGPDEIAGGGGTDTLVYPGRAIGVNVTVGAGNGNDGGSEDHASGRLDTVRGDVELVVGTDADDVLVGDHSSETLFGLGGDDLLIGGRGSDTLLGFDGNDLLIGQPGNDTLRGGLGDDRLFGKSGRDRLAAGPGGDFLHGGPAPDVIKGKKGIDRINAHDRERDVKINCGPGRNERESAKWDRGLDPRPRSC